MPKAFKKNNFLEVTCTCNILYYSHKSKIMYSIVNSGLCTKCITWRT